MLWNIKLCSFNPTRPVEQIRLIQIYHRGLFKFSSDLCIHVNVLGENKDKGNFSTPSLCPWGGPAGPCLMHSQRRLGVDGGCQGAEGLLGVGG